MTDLFFSVSSKPGVFGRTLYAELFKYYGYDGLYVPVNIDSDESFLKFLGKIKNIAAGMSVSMPFKKLASEYCKPMEFEVSVTKSANTIIFNGASPLAYNTDAFGFINACRDILKDIKTCHIYGNGSVARTISAILSQYGIHHTKYPRDWPAKTLGFAGGDLLINATPIGMDGINDSVFTEKFVEKYKSVFDVVVVKRETNLISIAKKLNKRYVSGVEMSKYQLQRQYALYTGTNPDIIKINQILQGAGYV